MRGSLLGQFLTITKGSDGGIRYHGDGKTRVKGPSQGWLHWGRVSPGLAMLEQGCPGVGYSWEGGWDGS